MEASKSSKKATAKPSTGETSGPEWVEVTEQEVESPVRTPVNEEEDEYAALGIRDRGMIKEEIGQALEKFVPTLLLRVEQTVGAKLEEFLDRYPVLREAEKAPEVGGAEMDNRKEKERFDFKNFSNCKPPEFYGELNPITSMRWIDEVEGTFMLCECPERLKVLFAAHQLKGRGREWWDLIVKSHGHQEAARFSWEKFREMFLEKFSPAATVERIKEEFLNIDQTEISVTEYSGEFTDKSRFVPEYRDNQKLLCEHYIRHLKPDIREFIDPIIYDTLPKIMNRALARERELQRKAADAAG